jgi:type II secretory pathway pseudopilin PulG
VVGVNSEFPKFPAFNRNLQILGRIRRFQNNFSKLPCSFSLLSSIWLLHFFRNRLDRHRMLSLRFVRHNPSNGYALLGILFMLTVLIVAMGAAAPAIKTQIQRSREEEMIHRGVQYSRAIKKYFVKFGRYPTSLEQLENTNNIRFLRKEYKDPMAADGHWRLLRVGDVTLNWTNVQTPATTGSVPQNLRQGEGLPAFRESPETPAFSNGTSAGMTQASPSTATTVSGARGAAGGASVASANNIKAINADALIGVASTSPEQGMHSFNDKTQYNQWYFVYDPTLDNGALIRRPYVANTLGERRTVPQTTQRVVPKLPSNAVEIPTTDPSEPTPQ